MNVKDLFMASIASGSKQGMPLIQEHAMARRPLIEDRLTHYQAPARIKLYPALSSVHNVNAETVGSQYILVISGLKCQQGQLWSQRPTSASC